MPSTKSKRHGRLRVCSGDTPALEFITTFTEGDFTFTVGKNIVDLFDRGVLTEFRKGDDTPLEWSFSGKFRDQTLHEVIDEMVYNGTTELITGLTPNVLNNAVPTTNGLGFKQGTLFITDPGFSKLAIGAVPAVAGEYSENAGVVDENSVTVATSFEVFMPAADTDINVSYGAVGASDTPAASCSDVKTYLLKFDLFDPCNPSNIEFTYELPKSTMTEFTLAEGDDFDTVSFSGKSLVIRPTVTPPFGTP